MGWHGEIAEDRGAVLSAIIDALPELLFVMDRDGRYLAVLGGLDDARYHDGRFLVGKTMHEVMDPAHADRFLSWIHEALDTNQVVHRDYELGSDDVDGVERRDGVPDHLWFEGHISPVVHGDGPPEMVVWLIFNVTESRVALRELRSQREVMEQQQRELERLVSIDHLTEVLNRRSFFAEVERERSWVARTGGPSSLVLFDLDLFKQINDTWGHGAGDDVLRAVSSVLRSEQRGTDAVGRLGGEEFAVLLRGAAIEDGERFAERLRSRIASLDVEHGEVAIAVTASLGVCEIRPDDSSADDVIKRADAAMYCAKARGRNGVALAPD